MATENEDVKPKVEGESIQLVVRDQDGGEVHFKVKPSTKFEKIFNAYCAKKSVQQGGYRYVFEGTRLQPDNTPAQAGMENDDCIDAFIEQLGGAQ